MKVFISVCMFLFFSASIFADTSQEYMDQRLKDSMTVTGHLFPDDRKHMQRVVTRVNECSKKNVWFQSGYERQDVLHTRLEKGNKRCEVVIHEMLRRDYPFSLSFDFMVEGTTRSTSDQWFMISQVHSKPNKKIESWRCPVLSLESHKGKLRMFSRWDSNKASVTFPGKTCAQNGTSISSRTMFRDYDYNADTWYNVKIIGTFSFTNENACLSVYIDDALVANECGLNTFNDHFHPFFKLGSYKPTTWRMNDDIRINYDNIKFNQD